MGDERECFLICHDCKGVLSSVGARYIAIVDTERIEQHRQAHEATGAELPEITYRATLCRPCWRKVERIVTAPDDVDEDPLERVALEVLDEP